MGHDHWLEYDDVYKQNEFYDDALDRTGLKPDEFEKAFFEEPYRSIIVKTRLFKIISGGQTGIDRLGLEIGRQKGFETGGTAPKNFRTERGPDYSLRDVFGLVESTSTNYLERTAQNIADADITVIFGNINSPGSKATIRLCEDMIKYDFVNPRVCDLQDEIQKRDVRVLNVAGNRASKLSAPDRQKAVATLTETLHFFKNLKEKFNERRA